MLIVTALTFAETSANEQPQPDIKNIEYYQLPNGLRVLLKERRQENSVSYRVVVNVGMADYPCGRKETPHFLEHLLFSGTSTRDESELNDLIEEHGGEWNAFTEEEKTVYMIDISNKHAVLALESLKEILTDSQISQKSIEKGRYVIHHESGGQPSVFKRWFYWLGFGISGSESAHIKLLKGTTYSCRGLDTADDITRSDILASIERYYVANNITLIVVGDFETADMKNRIELALGKVKAGEHNKRQIQVPEENTEKLVLTSTLTPLLGNQAVVGVAYAISGEPASNNYPRLAIEKLLSDNIYRDLRVEEAMSYAPAVEVISHANTDVWLAYADTELSKMNLAVDLIQKQIDQLVAQPISDELLASVKNKLKMSIIQGHETNRDIADYFAETLHEIQKNGALTRKEEMINAMTTADIQNTARQIFAKAPPIIFQDTPTITYTQLAVCAGLLILLLVFITFRYISQRGWRV